MGYILSCSTTPTRIDNLVKLIPMMNLRYKYFVINICEKYKRFGDFKIPKSLLLLCKKNKRIAFQFIDDAGPLCKYIGGFKFLKKKKLENDKLIIVDDDIFYHNDLFYELMDHKTKDNITTGSGFNYDENRNYIVLNGGVEMVEGYGGICFDYNDYNEFIDYYSGFYKCINDFHSKNDIERYLCASFLGDDFIISNVYENKYAVEGCRKFVNPQGYGLKEDALQNNNSFGSNMLSYLYLHENIEILNTFKKKYELNKEIMNRPMLFCSLSDRPELSAPMFEKLKEYCSYHNYKCVLEDKVLDTTRAPAWSKILLLQREMKSNPDIPLIVWIDDDIIITNKEKRFEELIKDYTFENILISREVVPPFNCGILVVKNNQESYDYLTHIWELCEKYPEYKHKPNWEQQIFIKDYYNDQSHIFPIPYRIIQSFYRTNNKDWKEGDFSAHITGMPLETRKNMRDEVLNRIKNI